MRLQLASAQTSSDFRGIVNWDLLDPRPHPQVLWHLDAAPQIMGDPVPLGPAGVQIAGRSAGIEGHATLNLIVWMETAGVALALPLTVTVSA